MNHKDLFIPTLHTFAMNNTFTGSCGDFRFRAKPNVVKKTPKEVDMEQSDGRSADLPYDGGWKIIHEILA